MKKEYSVSTSDYWHMEWLAGRVKSVDVTPTKVIVIHHDN